MVDDPEVIRQQIDESKNALAEKIELLEEKVSETVQTASASLTETVQAASASVAETVDTVKGAVQDTMHVVAETVDSAAEAVNISRHVEKHPWPMFLGAIALGCCVGTYWGQPQRPRRGSGTADYQRRRSRARRTPAMRDAAEALSYLSPGAGPSLQASAWPGSYGPAMGAATGAGTYRTSDNLRSGGNGKASSA